MKKIIMLIIVIGIALTGCSKYKNQEVITENFNQNNASNLSSENGIFTEDKIYYVTEQSFDSELVNRTFFGENENEMDKHINPGDTEEEAVYIKEKDGYSLFLLSGGISNRANITYAREQYQEVKDYYNNYLNLIFNGQINDTLRKEFTETFDDSKEITIDKEKTISMCQSYFDKLGITNIKLEQIYAMDEDGLNKLEREIFPEENYEEDIEGIPNRIRQWTDEKEAYFMIFHNQIENKEINFFGYDEEYQCVSDYNARSYAIADENGLVYMQINPCYLYQDSKDIQIISEQEAAKVVEKYLSNIMISNNTQINKNGCQYTAIYDYNKKDIQLIPTWSFTITNGDAITDTDISVNAITGELIK
ncbi:MAG: hypothetical protein ACERKZ_17550 [Lachnotalea sp.]